MKWIHRFCCQVTSRGDRASRKEESRVIVLKGQKRGVYFQPSGNEAFAGCVELHNDFVGKGKSWGGGGKEEQALGFSS